jgi:hypothetical protein
MCRGVDFRLIFYELDRRKPITITQLVDSGDREDFGGGLRFVKFELFSGS